MMRVAKRRGLARPGEGGIGRDMSARPLRFYYDFISPYAFLGWRQVESYAAEHQLELELVPILFAALLKEHGHKGPAEIPPKRIHTWKNVLRVATGLGIDISPPDAHPFNPLLALRVASAGSHADDRRALTAAIFDLVWGGGGRTPSPETLRVQLDARGLDGAHWLERATTPEVKSRLRASTETAIERGVFGVPSFEVGEEVFWGQDSLPHLTSFLAGRDPASGPDMERWLELPVGVTR